MILKDRGLPVNPEMAAGKYAPPVSGGTSLRSAARDLHFNGNIPSNLYVRADIQGNPYILRPIAQDGRSAIIGHPAGGPHGHSMVVDGSTPAGPVLWRERSQPATKCGRFQITPIQPESVRYGTRWLRVPNQVQVAKRYGSGAMPWLLDLLTAASGSIGLNGLGAFLVAFGSHPPHGTAAPKKGDAEPAKQDAPLAATVLALPPSNPGPVARFMVDRIEAAPRGSLKWPICFLHIRRGATLTATARCPSPFGDALAPMLEAVGIERKARGENVYLVGVKLAS